MSYIWLAAAAALVIAACFYSAWRRRPTPPPASALELFLAEDLFDRTIRETRINPATIDTTIRPVDWDNW